MLKITKIQALSLLILLLTPGCLPPEKQETAQLSATVAPTITASIQPTATATTTPTLTPIPPTATRTPRPTPTATNTPLPPSPTATRQFDSKEALLNGLIQAWQSGTHLNDLAPKLEQQEWLMNENAPMLTYPSEAKSWAQVDINGDGADEWLLSIITSDEFSTCASKTLGEFWVINGNGLIYTLTVNQDDYPYWNVPLFIEQADFNGDGQDDIVTRSIGCGAHTHMSTYHILSGFNGKITNIIMRNNELELLANPYRMDHSSFETDDEWSSTGTNLSNASYEIIDATDDGLPDLVLKGGTFNSAGAGYQSWRVEVWSWDGSSVSLADIYWEATGQRFHLLLDANFAYDLGDFEQALADYQQVIEDENLGDAVFLNMQLGKIKTQQFAAFRLVLLNLQLGDKINANKWRDWLTVQYPTEPIAEAAAILLASWPNSQQSSCADVLSHLENYDRFIQPLDTPGYGNRSLFAADLCPFGD